MNSTQHVTTLRQTHRAATSMLPVLTATLTVAGAVIAAMEARASHASAQADELADAPAAAEAEGAEGPGGRPAATRRAAIGGRVTVRSYIAALVGHVLLVALGIALVLTLVYAACVSGRVGQAMLLTALILLVLYLTEKIARRA